MSNLQIPEVFRDNTTIVKNHSIKTHIWCILLRITLGLLVINRTLPINLIILISLLVISMFGYKYFKLPHVWKVYLRTVLVYSIVLGLTLKYGDTYRHISGTLIIVDALMGLQARHIFERLSLLNKN
jgi:hypothetical protein